jgi:release factor glutamine methyltransferase
MSDPVSLQDIIQEISEKLRLHGFPDPLRHAEEILCDFLHCSRKQLREDPVIFNADQCKRINQWVERRLKGEPLAYIAQQVDFYGCHLKIKPSVLIPRPETEVLVDKIVDCLARENLDGMSLWDVCCGSGCIGIALKKRFPNLRVCLTDCSLDAIALSKENAAANQVDVHFYCGDLLTPLLGQRAHFLVCNPPYISEQEYELLDHQVKGYEPKGALVGGQSGLEFYRRLSQGLPSCLHPHAKVWFEIGYQQGKAVEELFHSPIWKRRHVEKDWAGHDRFFFLENE